MSKFEKLKAKIFNGQSISYEEAESLLVRLGFIVDVKGSHHTFRKKGFSRNVSLKRRSQLLPYQMDLLREVLKENEHEE